MSREMPFHPADEERVAAEMERELETMAMVSGIQPSEGFSDRVMAAIATEPLPQPVRAFGIALLAGHLRAAAGAVGDSWRVVTGSAAPFGVRAQALALVLVVAIGSLGIAGGAAVGAFGLLDQSPTPSPSPSVVAPSPSVAPSQPPSPSPTVSPSVAPTEAATPTSTATPTRTEGATPSPTGSDDHGGGSGSGTSGSGSGTSGSGSGSGSSQTPGPTGTDDHGGSDG